RVILRDDAARVRALRNARARAYRRVGAVAVAAIVSRHDVHDTADRVGAVQRGPLWAANHFDVIDRARREPTQQEWVRDLDAVDVDLGIAQPERARAADARV